MALGKRGINVFPNSSTSWHYNDKVGQKYLLESINASHIPTYVFYSKAEAFKLIKSAKFPLVFKLRGGASANNVKLVKNLRQATKLVKMAFGKGFLPLNRIGNIKDRIYKFREKKNWGI